MQVLTPEAKLTLQHWSIEYAALPQAVVGVLNRQRRQRIRLTLHEGRVQRAKLAQQDADGPAIGDDVVHADQQAMLLLGQLQQATTDQRSTTQLEGRVVFLFGVILRGDLGIWRVAQIHTHQRKADIGRCNHLCGAIVAGDETGAQGFVASDDAIQCLLQRGQVQHAVQVHAAGEQVRACGTLIELLQEPQSLLGVGQRQWRIAVGWDDRRQGAGGGVVQRLGQIDQARLGEQGGQRQFQAERAADARDQTYTEQ